MDEVLDQIDQTEVIDQTPEYQEDATPEPKEGELSENDKPDGRKFNKEWSQQLKELRDAYANDPERGPKITDMLTKLRDAYGRYQDVQSLAPKGLDDVRGWKSTIEALGGQEAAAEMMQRVADVEQIDARIESSDYGVISELPESMQKGFYGMIGPALNDLQDKDREAYEAAVMPHFAAALQGTGMGEHLQKMYAAAGDNQPLKDLIKQQFDWYQAQTSGAGKLPANGKQVNPEVQRLQGELSKRQEAEDNAFVSGITDTTNKYVEDVFTREAAVYLKQLNLSDSQKADLSESFGAKLVNKLAADAAFQKQLGAYKSLKNRSPEQVNTYIRSKIDESAKSIIDGLVTARYGGMKTKKADPSPTTTTTSNGAVRVAQAPDQSTWDFGKMEAAGYENTVKKGIFYLQGGRTVQLTRPN